MPLKENKNSTKRKRKSRKQGMRTLSKEQITDKVIKLLEEADKIITEDYNQAQEYAKCARRIQMRTRIKFPPQWKKRFCKHCKTFLYPGINSRVRLSSTNFIVIGKPVSISCCLTLSLKEP